MREILFRGKRKDNGKWVNGFLVMNKCPKSENGRLIYYTRPEIIPIGEIGEADYDGDGNYYEYVVMPKTVGQYTGLTDKNRKKIFEGDICQTKGYKLIDETPFIVVWNDYYSGFYWEDVKNANDTDMFTKTVAELTEVIGNIHDNPELLKGGAK